MNHQKSVFSHSSLWLDSSADADADINLKIPVSLSDPLLHTIDRHRAARRATSNVPFSAARGAAVLRVSMTKQGDERRTEMSSRTSSFVFLSDVFEKHK